MEGVQNVIVFNSSGILQQSTFNRNETIRIIGLIDELLLKVKRVIQLINLDDKFLSIRLRTKKFEVFITLDLDDLYFVIFQDANGKLRNAKFVRFELSVEILLIKTSKINPCKITQ